MVIFLSMTMKKTIKIFKTKKSKPRKSSNVLYKLTLDDLP